MKNSNFNHVESLNKMWNTLDPNHIKDLISENIHYESYWVLRPIRGKEGFLYYIERKLKTIKLGVERNYITIESQVVHTIDDPDEYFLILKHIMEGTHNESLIRVSVDNGKITRMGIEPVSRRFKVKIISDLNEEIHNSNIN